MSVNIYGLIPLKELKDNYHIIEINNEYWLEAPDGGTLKLYIVNKNNELYVDEISAFMSEEPSTNRYEIMYDLYRKYNMMNEDEFMEALQPVPDDLFIDRFEENNINL